jgi:hypothetical protein
MRIILTWLLTWFLAVGVLAQAPGQYANIPPLTGTFPRYARHYVQLDPERLGRMAAWREPDGTTFVVYQYRTPDKCVTELKSTILVDVVGAPIWEQHTGQRCDPRVQVNESYTRSGSSGIWKTHLGNGEADVIGKKFYTSAADVPEERALLVRALLAAGNRLELMPGGAAKLEEGRTMTIQLDKQAERVTQYTVFGLRTGQVSVWLDQRTELFAIDNYLIREGWEPFLGKLKEPAGLSPPVYFTSSRKSIPVVTTPERALTGVALARSVAAGK